MAGILEDTNDVLRQLQKLIKELGPVKTALAALAKRESTNPNSNAAAASLEKIANRVADVTVKYTPFMTRIVRLVEDDVPSTIAQTAFMAAPASRIAADIEAFRKKEDSRLKKEQNKSSTGNSLSEESDSDDETEPERAHIKGQRAEGSSAPAASLVDEVCPANLPFLVPPEYYQHYHDQLQMRVEMVEYLLATGRSGAARQVAVGYGLPLAWFPSFAAESIVANSNNAAGVANASSLRNTGMVNASFLSANSPLLTPANPPRNGSIAGGGVLTGMSPSTPVQLPAAAATASAAASTATAALLGAVSNGNGVTTATGAPVSPLITHSLPAAQGREGLSPPRVGTQAYLDEMQSANTSLIQRSQQQQQQQRQQHRPAAATNGSSFSPLAQSINASSPTRTLRTASPVVEAKRANTLPDLVARVIAAGVFLKDEYFDRMVLERLIDNNGFTPAWVEESEENFTQAGVGYNSRDNTQRVPIVRTASGHAWRPPHFLPPVGNVSFQRQRQMQPHSPAPTPQPPQQQAAADRRTSVMEKDLYEEAVVMTARKVTRSHICTQSGSTQFDDAMMNVIEEILASTLDQCNKRKSEGQVYDEQPSTQPIQKTRRLMTPDELLAAEDTFSSEVLFIKRPTRFYCAHSCRVMDGSGEGGTFPRALPNGMVIADSAIINELTDIRASKEPEEDGVGDRITIEVGVLCPPSDTFFLQTDLKRIFVT